MRNILVARIAGRSLGRHVSDCWQANSTRGAMIIAAVFVLALGFCGERAQAAVLANGNVLPADDPFTFGIDEGIPIDGNFIDPFSDPSEQVFFEGRPSEDLSTNENFDIIVGETSFGTLLISGESALRDMNLIIGDMGELPNGQTRRGTGVMRITGFGSLYNNDPNIIPPGLPMDFSSVAPRSMEETSEMGFDLYVGRFGTGTLEISLGGRAEIQDAVVVGDTSGSIGTLIVTGIDSFLGSGGFETGVSGAENVIHQMVIGRRGTGTMTISAGGQVLAIAPDTGQQQDIAIAAIIGSDPYKENDVPQAGGVGTVNVVGPESKWVLGGTLQIGGFHDVVTGGTTDIEGDDAIYANNVGRGTLNVSDGGLVNIISPVVDLTPGQVEQLDLVVGRHGTINLSGGIIQIDAGLTDQEENPEQLIDRVRLINDGIISGYGRITVGQFRNRALGEVRVAAGEKLLVEATGSYTALPTEDYPFFNYGLMEVVGTETTRSEIEFNRTLPSSTAVTPAPFINARINPRGAPAVPNGGRPHGIILAEWATLRFRSNLENEGVISFYRGDNIFSGNLINLGPSGPGILDYGTVQIGPDATVVFEDDFINLPGADFQVAAGAHFTVLRDSTFTSLGTMQIQIPGNALGFDFDPYLISGNAVLGGTLQTIFTGSATALLQPGVTIPIMSIGGTLTGNFQDIVTNISPTTELDVFARFFAGTLSLEVFSFASAIGADFNGDGIVDATDLLILEQSLGTTGPVGDANGDGIVDGRDVFLWQQQVGGPGFGAGAGAASGSLVPEPTGAALAALAGMLALAFRRRTD